MKTLKVLAAVSVLAFLSACTRIDTGNVGIEATLGQVKTDEMMPGVYFTLFKTVHEVTAKEVSAPLYDLKPKSKDNLTMADFDIDVYYRVSPERQADLLLKYAGDLTEVSDWDGKQWVPTGDMRVGHNFFLRQAREAAYGAAAEIGGADMHTKRTEIAESIRSRLQAELDKEPGKGFYTVTNVNVRNIVTDPALEESIRTSAKTRFEIERKNQEIQLAHKEAERLKIEAEGQARANTIIANSLTPPLIELRRIEAQQAFAKSGTHTVLLQGSASPLVQVK